MATVNNSTTTGVISKKNYWDKFCDLFIICAGANRKILEQCPTERPKYIISGFTIVFTAIMATFSGGYAFYYTFHSYYASIPLGIIWGFLIFNLDRAFVFGMRKPKIPTKAEIEYQKYHPMASEGWKAGPLRQERSEKLIDQRGLASIRIIVAVVIGIVIARPLELRLFKANIDDELLNSENVEVTSYVAGQSNKTKPLEIRIDSIIAKRDKEIEKLDSTNGKLRNASEEYSRTSASESSLSSDVERFQDQYDKVSPRYQKRNPNDSISKLKMTGKAQKAWNELQAAKLRLRNNNQQREKYATQKNSIYDELQPKKDSIRDAAQFSIAKIELQKVQIKMDDSLQYENKKATLHEIKESFLKRNAALGKLQDDPTTFLAVLLITLLIVLIETSPILVKLMTKRGVYDELLEIEEARIVVDKNKDLDKKFAGISASIKINRQNRNIEVQINNEIIKDFVLPAQREIAEKIINKWKQEQLNKI